MKEDYLWDRTGEDPEIEKFESALKTFRYRETAPPALPAPLFTPEREKPRRFFRLRFAFPAFAALALIMSVIWWQSAPRRAEIAAAPAAPNTPKRAEKTGDALIDVKIPAPVGKRAENPELSAVAPQIVKIGQNAPPAARRRRILPARARKPAEPAAALTAEEKYAYDQLMLALSITGSKLKIVKDKIDRIEDRNAVLETAR